MRFRLLLLALLLLLPGCGGGNHFLPATPTTGAGRGRATFTLVWPARTRLIPQASNSIKVDISQGSTHIDAKLLARPANGGAASVSFDLLPVGNLTATATAYPNADGTGTAQASASVPLPIQAGKNTAFSLTMATTITSLAIVPSEASVSIGQNLQLTLVAKDAAGNWVLTTPAQLRWTTSDANIAGVDTQGQVSGIALGTAKITVSDSDSHLQAEALVYIVPGNIVQYPANGHWYEAVDVDTLITWHEAMAAAAAMQYKGLHGHLATLTTQAESDFVTNHFPGDSRRSYWAGGYQDKNAPDYSEPAGGWRWVTGEPWQYTNWGVGEPSNDGNSPNFLDLFPGDYPPPNAGKWNDTIDNDGHGYGYIVEFE